MTQIIAEPMRLMVERTPNRVRLTRTHVQVLQDAGLLTGRYELIDGEIISKMGENPPHRIALLLLRKALGRLFDDLSIQVQSTIDVGEADPEHNEPLPDAAVTAEPGTVYTDRHPGPADLFLVVEASDTTLKSDLGSKALLYARAGIREYWVLDLTGRRLLVHRQPSGEGYGEIVEHSEEDSASTLARPDDPVRVSDLLPPAA